MKNKHLTLDDRKQIQYGIENGLSKTTIAKNIGKDPTTIGKEIKKRRKLKPRNTFNSPLICKKSKVCKKCYGKCEKYEEIDCIRRDKKVGACNLCANITKCNLDKYFYYSNKVHEDYLYTLKDSREGVNLDTSGMKFILEIIKPLLKKGQSVYQILAGHPEIKLCSKSLYTYIESGVFKDFGVDNFSLRRQVSMRARKKLKKRAEPANYDGKKYTDYLEFIGKNTNTLTTEMDTIYNQQDGPYIQTFYFQHIGFMIGFLHTEKTSSSMASTLDKLQELLDNDYYKLFSLLLTDRGPEFQKHELFEINIGTGEIRTNIFYCDPQTPSQKPHVENNHNYVRNILPNGNSLKHLIQTDIDLMFSHINSVPREIFNGKTPYDNFEFLYGKKILDILNIQKIEKDMVTLQPYLLKIK